MDILRLLPVVLLAGCASSPPRVLHVTWVKVPGLESRVETHKTGNNCLIITDDGWVPYDHFGAALRKCLEN